MLVFTEHLLSMHLLVQLPRSRVQRWGAHQVFSVLFCAGPCILLTCLQIASTTTLMHEHIPVYSHHLGSAIDLYWHALVPLHAHAARSCRAQCPQAPPAPHQAGRLGSTGVHRRAAHLFACLEGKGGPGHCVAAAPGVWRNRQSWPSVSCWTNSELQIWTIQFRHMGEGITCLTPADYTARLEGKLPRAVSSTKIVHGPTSKREK